MIMLRALTAPLCALAAALAWSPSIAQTYPAKPVRIIVPLVAGGSLDTMGRMMADKMSQGLGQPVYVENRPGASGDIGIGLVAKSPPDGYNLCVIGTGMIAIGMYVRKLPYDPLKDLAPVSGLSKSLLVIVTAANSSLRSLPELLAYAKANPGVVNFGSIGIGSTQHLSGELLNLLAGINMVHVPYKGAGEANTAVMGGQIHIAVSGGPGVAPHVRAGKMRALAVTDTKRSTAMPDVPAVSEFVPGYATTALLAFVTTGGTPPDVVARLNSETHRVLGLADVRGRITGWGDEPDPTTPEELGRTLRAEMQKWGDVIKKAGLKLQ
ncbi:MAG: tripartite tricarboxylate transporter substrate binding protein [Burkholderiales bacterium]|nr:tripartite tricarboxylate transporter substrate binding protein [Burkholderiales bacterium]